MQSKIDHCHESFKLPCLALFLSIALALAACASGSALIIGQPRAVIEDYSTIRILTRMPDGAEEIAIVKASSDMGMTQQGSLDYAVEELKKQAAKVGANAVVLTGRNTSNQPYSVTTYGGGTIIGSSEEEIIQGIAIWTK